METIFTNISDYLLNQSLQIIAQSIFWFHPLVWIANSRIRQEREKCCDESAIANLKTAPKDYGKAIVETLAREYKSNMPTPALAIAGSIKNIEDRIKTIMRPGKKFYGRCRATSMTVILLLAMVAVPTGLLLTAKAEITKETGKNNVQDTPNHPGGFGSIETDNKTNTDMEKILGTAAGTKTEIPKNRKISIKCKLIAIDKKLMDKLESKPEDVLDDINNYFSAEDIEVISTSHKIIDNAFPRIFQLNSNFNTIPNKESKLSGAVSIYPEIQPDNKSLKIKLEGRFRVGYDKNENNNVTYITDSSVVISEVLVEDRTTVSVCLDQNNKIMPDKKLFLIIKPAIINEPLKGGPKSKQVMFYGFDLSTGPVTTKPEDIKRLYYRVDPEIVVLKRHGVEIPYRAADGTVIYIPKSNIFYVEHRPTGLETTHYYGPFKGKPGKIIKNLPKGFGRLYYHGLDLPEDYIEKAKKAGAKYYFNLSDPKDLIKESPKGSGNYKIKDEVEYFKNFLYVPSKDVFYFRETDLGFTNPVYFGPIPGNPRTMSTEPGQVNTQKQILISGRFITAGSGFLEDIGLDALKTIEYKPEITIESTVTTKQHDEPAYLKFIDNSQIDFLIKVTKAHSDSRILTSPKVLVLDAQDSFMAVTKDVNYISGYEQDPNRPGEFSKKIETFNKGVELRLQPTAFKNRNAIHVVLEVNFNDLQGIEECIHESGKPYDVLFYNKINLKAQLPVPTDKTLVIVIPKLPQWEKSKKSKKPPIKIHHTFEQRRDDGETALLILLTPEFVHPYRIINQPKSCRFK